MPASPLLETASHRRDARAGRTSHQDHSVVSFELLPAFSAFAPIGRRSIRRQTLPPELPELRFVVTVLNKALDLRANAGWHALTRMRSRLNEAYVVDEVDGPLLWAVSSEHRFGSLCPLCSVDQSDSL